nr:efflux transporter outer membrane subunit [uncultured Noviherbaspirillum sp.]
MRIFPIPTRGAVSRLAALGAALMLASCASFEGMDSNAQPQSPQKLSAATSLPGQGGAWPSLDWATRLGGAPLQALVDEAMAGNPGLQVAAARIASARAAIEASGANGLPTLGAGLSSTYQRYTETGLIPPPLAGEYKADTQLALNFNYEFDFWGRHEAELRAALSQGRAAEAEQYSARLMLTSSIARAWLQLARQDGQLALTRQQLAARERLGRLAALRFKAGLDTESESEQTRQQLEGLRAEIVQWQEGMALTRNQIAALLGKGPDRGLSIVPASLPADAAIALPDALPLGLVGRRPDIVASRWRVEAAQGDIESARAQFYPNINLTAFAGFSTLSLDRLLDAGSRIVGIGPAIRLPVFEGGRLRAQFKGRVAGYDNAVASYNQTLTDALRDVADQVQSLRAAQAQGGHQRAATEAATNALRLARERERAGTTNMLPVLASELALVVQRKIELENQARRADLQVGLIRALGGGFEADAARLAPAAEQDHNRYSFKKSAP